MSAADEPNDLVEDLPAGEFSAWLRRTRAAQASDTGMDVPCGDCNACCRSSYFIHIRPEETEALTRIPTPLLFAAPGLPAGNVLMGYDEQGHCPMLVDDRCSIYEHRPLTCRQYDCRVFPAAGLSATEDDKALISQRTRHWKFSYPSEGDRTQHSAVRTAAKFLRERAECFPNGVPNTSTQLAVLAIKVYDVFSDANAKAESDPEVAKMMIEANQKFDKGEEG